MRTFKLRISGAKGIRTLDLCIAKTVGNSGFSCSCRCGEDSSTVANSCIVWRFESIEIACLVTSAAVILLPRPLVFRRVTPPTQFGMCAMKLCLSALAIATLALVGMSPDVAVAQVDNARFAKIEQQLRNLEQKTNRVERRVSNAESRIGPIAVFVCAAFCALWAQQTGRNAWLWFFLGLFFNVITLLVLLYKNSQDLKRQRWDAGHSWTRPQE